MDCHSMQTNKMSDDFECAECKMMCKSKRGLAIHSTHCEKKNPFRCQYCQRILSTTANKRRHEVTCQQKYIKQQAEKAQQERATLEKKVEAMQKTNEKLKLQQANIIINHYETNNNNTVNNNNVYFDLHEHMQPVTDDRLRHVAMELLNLSNKHTDKTINAETIAECIGASLGNCMYVTDKRRGSVWWKDGRQENPRVKFDKHGERLNERFKEVVSNEPIKTAVKQKVMKNSEDIKMMKEKTAQIVHKYMYGECSDEPTWSTEHFALGDRMTKLSTENFMLTRHSNPINHKILHNHLPEKKTLETTLKEQTKIDNLPPLKRVLREYITRHKFDIAFGSRENLLHDIDDHIKQQLDDKLKQCQDITSDQVNRCISECFYELFLNHNARQQLFADYGMYCLHPDYVKPVSHKRQHFDELSCWFYDNLIDLDDTFDDDTAQEQITES
jgi:hypothetical protein